MIKLRNKEAEHLAHDDPQWGWDAEGYVYFFLKANFFQLHQECFSKLILLIHILMLKIFFFT